MPTPGYFIIAMGKLGAFELNYSSDIDIIVFYDADRAGLSPDVEPSTFFVRLTRELVRLLQEHTADGYVFRTDLRLRPDPGRDTDRALHRRGADLLRKLRPELGARGPDQGAHRRGRCRGRARSSCASSRRSSGANISTYAAIADIHAMKRRVHAYKGHGAIAVEGHDIKLGRGGIRDIEFFAQTQQLIAGGRHPELRSRGTIETLERLAAGGWIAKEAARELTEAYLFLRRVENRLQMVGDQQTHIIPAEPERARAHREALGLCRYQLVRQRAACASSRASKRITEPCSRKLPEPPASAPRIVVTADEADPAALAAVERLGFRNPQAAIAAIRAWQSGRYVATRSDAARERLIAFLPSLLDAFGRTADPDLALATFDKVDRRDAGRVAALLAACRQPKPAPADRRHHGNRAAARAHHRQETAAARRRARSRVLRCGADASQAEGAGRRGAGRGPRLRGRAGSRPHCRP